MTSATHDGTGSTRTEQDSMGEVEVPADALYGAQTQRAVDNFAFSGLALPRGMIEALAIIKANAARVNAGLNLLDADITDAIISAAAEVEAGSHDAQFPIDVFQTGSGTSSNMNANEVIAHLASDRLGRAVHPNDHVNMSQSSNDTIPTAIHISAALAVSRELLPALKHLQDGICARVEELDRVVKTGRTHLMDAMPISFGQELSGWAFQICRAGERLKDSLPRLRALAQGGTAVGTGVNAHPEFGARFAESVATHTGEPFTTNLNYFEALSTQDTAVEVSGQLKTLAVSIMKIANDLRWMNSGPLTGIGDIELPALQPGSSIMPGKVNPVAPEAAAQAAAQVIGNDATITVAGQSGNFQLNVMLPLVGYNLLQSIQLLSASARALADQAIAGFKVNHEKIEAALARNPILVTALNRRIGYDLGAAIAKQAYREGRPVIDVALDKTDLSRDELARLLNPLDLTRGGISE